MQGRVIKIRNGKFSVYGVPRPIPALTAEDIWTARCELRRGAVASAMLATECPQGARLFPLAGSHRVLIAIVDEEDYAQLSCFAWMAWTRRGYALARAVTRMDGRLQQLSRLILHVGHRYHHVIHANGNTLDCRKVNLRVVIGKERRTVSYRRMPSQSKPLAPNREDTQIRRQRS